MRSQFQMKTNKLKNKSNYPVSIEAFRKQNNGSILKCSILVILLFMFLPRIIIAQKSAEKISGIYNWYGAYDLGADLVLEPDGTYSYELQSGLINFKSEGEWNVINNQLFISSTYQPRDTLKKYFVEQKTIPNTNNTFILIVNESGEPNEFAVISFFKGKNQISVVLDTITILEINNIDYDSLIIWAPSYYPIHYKKTDKSNFLRFRLVLDRSLYIFFSNKVFIIRKNKLIDPDRKKTKFIKSRVYQKIE